MQETVNYGALTVKVDVPAVRPRGFVKAHRAALDLGIKRHRGSYLQRHFTASAFTFYPTEFAPFRSIRQRQSVSVQEAMRRYYRAQAKTPANYTPSTQRRAPGSNLDPRNERPLYHTGRAYTIAINGPLRFVGAPNVRRGVINGLPWYLRFRPGGWPAVLRALQAVHTTENAAFAKTVSTELQAFLDGKAGGGAA